MAVSVCLAVVWTVSVARVPVVVALFLVRMAAIAVFVGAFVHAHHDK